ncbi:MAG: IS66 family insertion sequence element accessory protein TnpB [Oscillospiraceae bacterium]|nr:IS66 family insertion sequence element accessory protein TnpB [Oscillospiraceae bacterium]
MIQKRQSSGLPVKDWCADNDINIKTYYYRLKRVREFVCDNNLVSINNAFPPERHDIVPVPAEPMPDNNNRKIKITSANISVELPAEVQPELLKTIIEGLKC